MFNFSANIILGEYNMKKENLTKQYIFEAYKCLLEKKQYDEISVCDICEKAGVSRMSFYRNFESKEDLTMKGIEQIAENMRENLEHLETVNHYYIIKEFFETFKQYKLIIPSFEGSEIANSLLLVSTNKLNKNMPNDLINKTSKYIPIFYLSAISATLFEWLKDGTKESTDEMARLICSLINGEKFDIPKNDNSEITQEALN